MITLWYDYSLKSSYVDSFTYYYPCGWQTLDLLNQIPPTVFRVKSARSLANQRYYSTQLYVLALVFWIRMIWCISEQGHG